jgi:HAD superfamily hydrolase (TIGR01484 family)
MRAMQPFARLPRARLGRVRFVLTDVDDTLTEGARLSAATYDALERLTDGGFRVIPITAAPAGWCDLMCRMWPVAAVVGENGGLCFRHDPMAGETERHFWTPMADRRRDRDRLAEIGAQIQALVPGCALATDQSYRETTLAFRNAAPPMPEQIIAHLGESGMRTVVNSLWVLGWLGDFDKLAMTRRMLRELFATDIERQGDAFLYVGDSFNDEPMFGFFANSVGVATVRNYADRMATPPQWVTEGGGGRGFVEIADALLRARSAELGD